MMCFTTINRLICSFSDTFSINQVTTAQGSTQIIQPLSRSNPLWSDSQPTSCSWIRWMEHAFKKRALKHSARHSRSRLSDLSDSLSNANPTTMQWNEGQWKRAIFCLAQCAFHLNPAKTFEIEDGPKICIISLSLSFPIKLTQGSVFCADHSYSSSLIPCFNESSSKVLRAGEDQDSRGLFRDEISCHNSTISEELSWQKYSKQTHNKAPTGQIKIDEKK